MNRVAYAGVRLAEALLSSVSRFGNAVFLGGSTSISISARAALEPSERWQRSRRIIDRVLWFDHDHCQSALNREVELARKTLAQVEQAQHSLSRMAHKWKP